MLKTIVEQSDCDALPVLRDHFMVSGPNGEHLCILMDPLSSDLGSFRRTSPTKALPAYMVKNIIALVLGALGRLHKLQIIHTGIGSFHFHSSLL